MICENTITEAAMKRQSRQEKQIRRNDKGTRSSL
ncbi:hypothetical protein FOXB_13732 [Fusarium oxysporum f. sp. conglutinans Fo5176]|uniref:Uncharacterized protein n=1 Tax=Fusarium oxysporum (strain Fo5176) TaxID=660025 RepID=F9G500_FUSOF|nr:hypothetical protein FOXB_13732 [Fusarium oxysporum f. sp. conglutinans Fo5176]